MNTNQTVSEQTFVKRLADLCLRSGLADFPKNPIDRHILMKSAVIMLDRLKVYTETEINESLKIWTEQVGQIPGIDHGTLRRSLIDHGYLARETDGSAYRVSPSGPGQVSFEASIERLDPRQVLEDARREQEERKRLYMEKAKKQGR